MSAPARQKLRHPRTAALAAAAAAALVVVAAPASADATLVWDGNPAQGTNVFGNVECASPGNLRTTPDADGRGTVFQYSKSVGVYRCESRGAKVNGSRYKFAADRTYWLGWEQKFSVVPGGTDWVPWQWKSYPNADQNYPVLMTVGKGRVSLVYVGPGGAKWQYVWSRAVRADEWHRVAIGIHTAKSASSGWIELYYDGVKQNFANGSARLTGRTWDSANEPKWGAYDRGNTKTAITNRVGRLRIGTTYADVS
ncbi:hypothetical protein GCM10010123_45300 [Pilimelia anulata]|uniref:Polysaccharide lyase n=1 Tax=Pilimelia anulata TaxID=53371 RepID=A0A8J3BGZ5_9ACTN|nr:heparin lyase I family protein [Pilimelia anulata]GGK10276.1 hypothetical protein GCM10010123_45300 [Pilimelia anulata]